MYTPELDRVSVEDIIEEPRLVVRQSKTIDGRHPVWDAPSYQRHLYCEYEIIDRSETWQVLEKAESSRCGPLTTVAEHDVKAGEVVAVPSTPGEITFGHVLHKAGYATALAGKWQMALLKEDPSHVGRAGFAANCCWAWHEASSPCWPDCITELSAWSR